MPTPESASAAAYGGQPGGLPYGSAPPGGAPGYGVSIAIAKTCPSNIQRLFSHVKIKNFI